jgi:hypothetical protein
MPNDQQDGPARSEIERRLDQWLDAQKTVVRHVGGFVLDATDMTIKGEWSPINWMARYGRMWTDLADELRKSQGGQHP